MSDCSDDQGILFLSAAVMEFSEILVFSTLPKHQIFSFSYTSKARVTGIGEVPGSSLGRLVIRDFTCLLHTNAGILT